VNFRIGWRSVLGPQMIPLVASPWPLRNFVPLWKTTSAPHSRGRQRTGVAKVLSTIRSAPAFLAAFETAARSATPTSGFEIVSIATALVPGRIASGRSSGPTNSTATPIRGSSFWK
jgi:hypothetical protein